MVGLSKKPCPFGSGFKKFALDFVVVVFFKNVDKYKIKSNFKVQNQTITCVLSAFMKKNTTLKSGAIFLSPDSNEQKLKIHIPLNLAFHYF